MIRQFCLADFLTLANAACGTGAIFLAMLYEKLSAGSGKVAYFEGTPIPTSIALTGCFALAAWNDRLGVALAGGEWAFAGWTLHPLSLLFFASGTLMISKTLRIPKP